MLLPKFFSTSVTTYSNRRVSSRAAALGQQQAATKLPSETKPSNLNPPPQPSRRARRQRLRTQPNVALVQEVQQERVGLPVDCSAGSTLNDPQRELFLRILSSRLPEPFKQPLPVTDPLTTSASSPSTSSSPPPPQALPTVPAASAAPAEPVQPVVSQPVKSQPVNEDSETCSISHPGSVSCSTVRVTRDEKAHSVQITVQTTVNLAKDVSMSVRDMNDLELIGLLATAQQLQDRAAALNERQALRVTSSTARHEQLLHALSTANVVSADKLENPFGHVAYRVVLEEPDTRRRINALFKPCVEGNCEGWHRAEVEAVAYHLNLLLGMDYVPPCVFRPTADVDFSHFSRGGTLMYWAENGRPLHTQPMDRWGIDSRIALSDTRILDVLLQNSDRHHGHFLWAEHWSRSARAGQTPGSNGSNRPWQGVKSMVLIDHAAGFRPEAFVDMRHDNAFGTGSTEVISARTFLRLRCLDRATLARAVHPLLMPSEIDAVMRRRDAVLAYFDQLVATRGYDKVVIEPPEDSGFR